MRMTDVVAGLAACAALMAAAIANAGVNQWTIKGPPGGEMVYDFAASTTNPDVYYVIYNRVLARSRDGAVTWQSIGNFSGYVVDIAVDPTDGNRIYVAVQDEGLFRSDDGGDAFVQIASSFLTTSVGVGGTDGRVVYYAAGPAVYRSADRGATWTATSASYTPQVFARLLVEGADGNTVIGINSWAYRSTDGGASWSQTSSLDSIYSLLRLSPTALVAATGNGVFISNDNAASWTQKLVGVHWSVAQDPGNPATLYAAPFSFGPIMRSTDSGANWNPAGSNLLADIRGLLATSSGTTTRLVGATTQGVLRSTNGGTTWTESSSGPIASSPLFATTLAANSRVYAYTVGDGLFTTSMDNGWQRIDLTPARANGGWIGSTQAFLTVTPGAPQSIYLVPFGRAGLRSTDGGASWTRTGLQLDGLDVTALATDPLDGRIMYATVFRQFGSPPATLYRSADSGANWAPHSVDLDDVIPQQIAIDPADGRRIFLASYYGLSPQNSGGLYRSTDGGLHWTERGLLNARVRSVAIDPSNSNRVYATTLQGLQVSTDGGDSFTRNDPFSNTVSPLSAGVVVIDPVVPTTLYATSFDSGDYTSTLQQGSAVARSVDRGQTWEVLHAATDRPAWYAGDMVLDPNLPSLIYVNTGVRGAATFEIQNDLSVAITGHSGTRPVGVDSNFAMHARNDGPLAATAVEFSVALPLGLTGVTATTSSGSCAVNPGSVNCLVAVLRPGQSADVNVQYRPPGAVLLALTAYVSAHERDNASANNTAQASALAGEVIDLRTSVTPSAASLDHGDNLTYEVQVFNDGPVTASVVNVIIAGGTGVTFGAAPAECATGQTQLVCVYNNLAPGSSRTISIPATAGGIGALAVNVSAAGAAAASDTNTANNAATSTITSRAVADLGITATDSADPVQTGTAFTYTAEVRNNGPDEMTAVTAALTSAGGATSATSTRGTCTILGANVNCALGAMASGATATITVSTAVTSAGTNTLHAVVSGGGTDKVAGNNATDQATAINAPPASSSGGGGKGGGGGSMDAGWLALGLLLLARRRQAPAPRS